MVKKNIKTDSDLVKEIYAFDPGIIESVRGTNTLELEINFLSINIDQEQIKKTLS